MLLSTVSLALLLAYQAPTSSEDLHSAYTNLKSAEEKKDVDGIKKWAVESSNLALAIIKAPVSSKADEAEAVKSTLDFAKEVETYAEYSLYTAALRASDRDQMMQLYDTLEQQAPTSQYLPKLNSLYIGALSSTGKQSKAFGFAEKAIARDPSNEDLLAVLADGAMARKQWERAAGYGTRLASVMSSHAKPEGVPVGDWEHRRAALIGRGYWIAGISYATLTRHAQTDKNLRAALPYIQDEPVLKSSALFFLGVANYGLARATNDKVLLKQALNFSEQAAAIPGAYQQQAAQNVYAMKQELSRFR